MLPSGHFQFADARPRRAEHRAEAAGDVGAVEELELGDRPPAVRLPLPARRSARARCAAPAARRPIGGDARWAGLDRSTAPRKSRAGRPAALARSARASASSSRPRAAVEGAADQLEVGAAVGRHREALRSSRGGRQVQRGCAGRGGARPSRRRGRRRAPGYSSAVSGGATRSTDSSIVEEAGAASSAKGSVRSAPSSAASAKAPSDSATMRRPKPRRARASMRGAGAGEVVQRPVVAGAALGGAADVAPERAADAVGAAPRRRGRAAARAAGAASSPRRRRRRARRGPARRSRRTRAR